jgi:predicted phosphodiesterase
MRIAVISDIHGDLDSLRQVLTAIDRGATEQIWCLGDIVGLGATAPAEVVDLVRDRCALALAGNHDRWVTGQLSRGCPDRRGTSTGDPPSVCAFC